MFTPPAPPHISRRRWFIRLTLLGLGALLAWGGCRGCLFWTQKRLLRQAHEFLNREDLRSASLTVRQTLQINPRNVEAARLMADIAERVAFPEAILWRGRVVELDPNVPSNRVIWARTALRFGEVAVADQALLGVPPAGQRTAAYHQTVAALALTLRQIPMAEAHFLQAARLEPRNPLNSLNLAITRLQSANSKVVEAARAALQQLKTDPVLRRDALRALLADAVARGANPRALALAEELQADPSATFRDRLLHLGMLCRLKRPEFAARLQQIQVQAGDRGPDLYEVILWMNANGMAAQALAWGKTLPSRTLTQPPVALGLADSYAALRDWDGLRQAMESAHWPGMDFLRLAHLSRAILEGGDAVSARVRWRAAVSATGGSPEALLMLAHLCQTWGWTSEIEELCWTLSQDPHWARWALITLYRQYEARRNARGLLKVVARAVELNPSDLAARNNLALLSLLLKVNTHEAGRIAREVYSEKPSNLACVSTYAFSLYSQGRTQKAIQLLEGLKPSQLENPNLAAYFGLFLASRGEIDRAQKYLKLAERARLLPEEQALLAKARREANMP